MILRADVSHLSGYSHGEVAVDDIDRQFLWRGKQREYAVLTESGTDKLLLSNELFGNLALATLFVGSGVSIRTFILAAFFNLANFRIQDSSGRFLSICLYCPLSMS